MILSFFHAVFYTPIYNALVALLAFSPGGDVGIAIIVLTILVRLLLLPLSIKAARTQRLVKQIEPLVAEIKKKHKDSEEQMRHIMALYKEKGFNPVLNFVFLFIQLPVIFSLYYVFYKGGIPVIHTELLYPFTPVPVHVSVLFLNFLDMSKRSIALAVMAGVAQFFLFRLTFPAPPKLSEKPSLKEELSRNLSIQMRYIFPLMIIGIGYGISAAVALYWTVSNIVSIGQEYYVRHHLGKEQKEVEKEVEEAEKELHGSSSDKNIG
jgi:YidC/Oxa1 family membrane protein insertase